MMHKDEVTGKVEQAKGKIKQKVGRATNDPQLVDEGVDNEIAGEAQEGVGKVKRKVADAADTVAKTIRRNSRRRGRGPPARGPATSRWPAWRRVPRC